MIQDYFWAIKSTPLGYKGTGDLTFPLYPRIRRYGGDKDKMSFDKHTSVKRHIRDGRPVKRHFRRLKKDMKKVVNPTRDQFEIVELDNIEVIEVPAEVFNQIEAGVTPPIQGLKNVGFSDTRLEELFELNGISDTGEVVIRNATSRALKHVQLLNFQDSEVIIENNS